MRQVFHNCNASRRLSQLHSRPNCFYFLVDRYSIIESSTFVELERQNYIFESYEYLQEGVGCELLLLMFWQ
jgi:hypothetical protein